MAGILSGEMPAKAQVLALSRPDGVPMKAVLRPSLPAGDLAEIKVGDKWAGKYLCVPSSDGVAMNAVFSPKLPGDTDGVPPECEGHTSSADAGAFHKPTGLMR